MITFDRQDRGGFLKTRLEENKSKEEKKRDCHYQIHCFIDGN